MTQLRPDQVEQLSELLQNFDNGMATTFSAQLGDDAANARLRVGEGFYDFKVMQRDLDYTYKPLGLVRGVPEAPGQERLTWYPEKIRQILLQHGVKVLKHE